MPITVSQEITFDQILPFGTYTDGEFTAGAWSVNPFPFTDASQITAIRFWFDSTDADYVDGIGPLGGTTWVEINVVDDVPTRIGVASVNHPNPDIWLGDAQDPLFSQVRNLLLDGQLIVRLGGFESFGSFTDDFTLGRLSTLRLEISGDVPDPTPVPEPGTLLAVDAGLAGLARRIRRTR